MALICDNDMRPHLDKVLAGEYEVPYDGELKRPLVILDLGANVGAFTQWAQGRWPGARVIAYEPCSESAAKFRLNCPDVELHQVAVWDKERMLPLFAGTYNTGEASLLDYAGTPAIETVKVIHAAQLPPCDIIKLDVEGCEFGILGNYPWIDDVKAVMLEWHHPQVALYLKWWMKEKGFWLIQDSPTVANGRGILKWRRV
jgi:FkbM family methyltransferase